MADSKSKTASKAPVTPEQKSARRAAKILAFHTWRDLWSAENPDGTKEQRGEAWQAARAPEMRKARKALKRLEKGGYKLVAAEA